MSNIATELDGAPTRLGQVDRAPAGAVERAGKVAGCVGVAERESGSGETGVINDSAAAESVNTIVKSVHIQSTVHKDMASRRALRDDPTGAEEKGAAADDRIAEVVIR